MESKAIKNSGARVSTCSKELFSIRSDSPAILLLILFWTLIVFRSFSPKFNTAIFPDNEAMTNPLLSFMSRTLKSNSWPFWSDSLWGGLPLYNQPQLTPYYPFYFLKFADYSGAQNSMRTIHLIVLMHVLIFLLTSYMLLRALRVSPQISVAGSLIIVVNGNTLGILVWLSAIATISWTPMLIAGLILIFREQKKYGFAVYFTALLLIASASPSHRLIFGFYLTFIVALFFYFQVNRRERSKWLKSLLRKSLLPLAVFLAAFIPIFAPFFFDAAKLIRWVGDPPPGYVVGNSKIPYENFTHLQLSPSQFLDIFMKSSNQHPIGNVHIGIFVSVIFCISIYFGFRTKVFKLFLGLSFYSLFSAFGTNFGFSMLNYQIPFIDKIREPIQFLVYWHLFVGVCIALGMQQLFERYLKEGSKKNTKTKSIKEKHSFLVKKRVLPTLFMLTTFICQYQNTPWQMHLMMNSTFETEKLDSLNLVFDRLNQLDPEREYRTIFDQSINSQVAGGLASFKDIRTLQSLLNPAPLDLFETMFVYNNNGPLYINSLGIKFGICKDCGGIFAGGEDTFKQFEFSELIGDYSIFINHDAFPYAFLTDSYQGFINSRFDIAKKIPRNYEAKVFTLLDIRKPAPRDTKQNLAPRLCKIRKLQSSSNSREFISQCQSNSIFVLNEHFTENWRLSIDGKKVTPIRVNETLLGATIPKGTHRISLEYFPKLFENSLRVSLLLLAVIFFSASYQHLRSFRRRVLIREKQKL